MRTKLKKVVIPILMHILLSEKSVAEVSPAAAGSAIPMSSQTQGNVRQDSPSPYEFRADGSRLRSTEEIVALYSMAAAHGVHTGLFTLSFRDELEGRDDYHDSYGYRESRRTRPGTYLGLGTIFGTLGSAGAVYAIDNWGDGFKYGVPMAAVQAYGLGTLGSILTLAAVDQTWGDSMSFKSAVRTTWLASSLSAVAGGWAAHEFNIRPGQSAFMGAAGAWPSLLGMTFASMIVPYTREGLSALLWTGVGAYTLGLGFSSYLVANGYSPSSAQVQYAGVGGLIGSLVGVGVGWLMIDRGHGEHDDSRARINAAALGVSTLAGLGLGAYFARDLPNDVSPLTKDEAVRATANLELAVMPTPQADGAQVQLSWKF